MEACRMSFLVVLCLAAQAFAATPKQIVFSPPPPPAGQTFNAPAADFGFLVPIVEFTQGNMVQVCAVLQAQAGGASTNCLSTSFGRVAANTNMWQVFGTLVWTFAGVPTPQQLVTAGIQRDALVAAFTAKTPALFSSTFGGVTVTLNCDAGFASTTAVPPQGPGSQVNGAPLVAWSTTPGGWSANGNVARTPIDGAYSQNVATPSPTLAATVGIDTGRYCASGIAYPGVWAPACDANNSPGFPVVWVTTGGYSGVAVASTTPGAYQCPTCYGAGGSPSPFSYVGPNKGKYCANRALTGGITGVINAPHPTETSAYSAAASCVAVGVQSNGALCAASAAVGTPLYAGPSQNTETLAVAGMGPNGQPVLATSGACQALGVDSLTGTPCATVRITSGPAPALAASPAVVGNPFAYGSPPQSGSYTCNAQAYFTSTIMREANPVATAKCLMLPELVRTSATSAPPPVVIPSPPPPPAVIPSPPPVVIPSPPPPPPVNSPPPPVAACQLQGSYQLIANGRDRCSPGTEEYIVYNGGSTSACKSNTLTLKKTGQFDDVRSYWNANTNAALQTKMQAAGRGCSTSATYMSASTTQKTNTTVSLSAGQSTWQVIFLSDDCSLVNVVNVARRKKNYPAFLSASTSCSNTKLTLASKDGGSGAQQWTLDPI